MTAFIMPFKQYYIGETHEDFVIVINVKKD